MRAEREEVRAHVLSLGFAACGFTTASALPCRTLLEDWVARGRNGYMEYLSRGSVTRVSPEKLLDGARTVIVAVWPYAEPPPLDAGWRESLTGRVAAYALGPDYHATLAAKLEDVGAFLGSRWGARSAVHVDAGPLVEKDLARRAGLGWYGYNTNILSRTAGSFTLLACLVTDLDLGADAPFQGGHCGTCRDCIPACPTGALDDGPTIDARRCISYLTIELRGPIPAEFRPLLGNWVFGCDDCQTVCPWNESGEATARGSFLQPELTELLALDDKTFRERYGDTAVARTKRAGLARNAAVALGNTGNPRAVEPLARALAEESSDLVRAHAAWALGRIGTANALRVLATHSRREPPPVEAEILAARKTAVPGPESAGGRFTFSKRRRGIE
jgi:epoxyqueuosine reductase